MITVALKAEEWKLIRFLVARGLSKEMMEFTSRRHTVLCLVSFMEAYNALVAALPGELLDEMAGAEHH